MVQYYHNLTGWFHDYIAEQRTDNAAAEIYANSGGDGLVQEVCSNASSEISEEIAHGNTTHRSFNAVAGEWPYKAKKMLAAYEYAEQDRDDDHYVEDLLEFTEDVPFEEMVQEEIQTTLGPHFSDNPFTDENLTDDEARAVMAARVHHEAEMTDEQVGEIAHLGNFLEALQQCEGVEEAIRAHRFDQSLPDGVRSVLAHPDEWNDLQPADIPTRRCGMCGNPLYEVYHVDSGRCFVNRDGDVQAAHEVGNAEDGDAFYRVGALFTVSEDERDILCDTCMDRWEEQGSKLCVSNGDGRFVSVKTQDGYVRDYANSGDAPDATPLAEMGEGDFSRKFFGSFVGESENIRSISFSPNEGPAPDSDVEVAMRMRMNNFGDDIPECRVAVAARRNYEGQLQHFIEVPRDSPAGARWAKELLESPDLTVSA